MSARNVAFISNLMESGVEFHAADFPQTNRLTVHILAAVAEHEAEVLSERTKASLAAKRPRRLPWHDHHQSTAGARAALTPEFSERDVTAGHLDQFIGAAFADRHAL